MSNQDLNWCCRSLKDFGVSNKTDNFLKVIIHFLTGFFLHSKIINVTARVNIFTASKIFIPRILLTFKIILFWNAKIPSKIVNETHFDFIFVLHIRLAYLSKFKTGIFIEKLGI